MLVATAVVLVTVGGLALVGRGLEPASGSRPAGRATAGPGPGEVAEQFLAAWQTSDWQRLQALTADQALDAGGQHALVARAAGITGLAWELGALDDDEPGRVEVPARIRWELGDLGTHAFTTTLTLVTDAQGRWRVRWWYPTVHPDLTPQRHVERVRRFRERAPILAHDGRRLAATEPTVVVGAEPRLLGDVDALAATLDGLQVIGPEDLRTALDQAAAPDSFVVLATLSAERYAQLRPRLGAVEGLRFRRSYRRLSETGAVAAGLVGRVGEVTAELLTELGGPYGIGDVVGHSGLERAFERRLAGTPQAEVRIMEGDQLVRTLAFEEGSAPAPVSTTIDVEVQAAAEQAVAGLADPVGVVVIDAATGAVRAAVSAAPDGVDRALAGRYPPGSTFKIVTAAAALQAGIGPEDPVECPAETRIGGRVIRNAGDLELGRITLAEALARSCNTAFARLAADLGADALARAAATFGFGADPELGLPAFGGSFPPPRDDAELAAAGIGQARVEASPLHMASVAAAVVRGSWQAPHLVGDAPAATTGADHRLDPALRADLAALLRGVVAGGTGNAADVAGEPVIGKTGSAQFGSGDPLPTHAWFVGARGPLAFAVVVEGGGAGGRVAAPVAARLLELLDQA